MKGDKQLLLELAKKSLEKSGIFQPAHFDTIPTMVGVTQLSTLQNHRSLSVLSTAKNIPKRRHQSACFCDTGHFDTLLFVPHKTTL